MSMDTLIAAIDAEIARLQQARGLLAEDSVAVAKKRGRTTKPVPATKVAAEPVKSAKRNISAEGRARSTAAVKARWAKVAALQSAGAKSLAEPPAKAPAKTTAKAPAKAGAKAASKQVKKVPVKTAPAKKAAPKKVPARKTVAPARANPAEPVEVVTPQE